MQRGDFQRGQAAGVGGAGSPAVSGDACWHAVLREVAPLHTFFADLRAERGGRREEVGMGPLAAAEASATAVASRPGAAPLELLVAPAGKATGPPKLAGPVRGSGKALLPPTAVLPPRLVACGPLTCCRAEQGRAVCCQCCAPAPAAAAALVPAAAYPAAALPPPIDRPDGARRLEGRSLPSAASADWPCRQPAPAEPSSTPRLRLLSPCDAACSADWPAAQLRGGGCQGAPPSMASRSSAGASGVAPGTAACQGRLPAAQLVLGAAEGRPG